MLQTLIGKLLNGFVTLFVVMTLTFFLLRLLPGGPFDQDRQLPPAVKANMEARFHLDAPLHRQYVAYLGNIVRGDLGPSYKYQTRNVTDIVREAGLVSAQVGILALIIGIGGGILLGTLAGITRNRFIDGVLSALGMASISMPGFIFGALLVLAFSYYFNLLPAARLASPQHYVMPVAALSLMPFAYAFLLVRTAVREVRLQQFVMMKESYGLPAGRITFKHVLRNALLPLLSILGPVSAAVVTGSFAVELIFAVPGLGKYFVTAVSNRDYTLVMGITLVYSALLVVLNTLTEVGYGMLDPRMRDGGRAAG